MRGEIVLFCVPLALACTPSSEFDDAPATTVVSPETTSMGEEDTTSMGEEDTGGELPDLGICEQYLDCVEAAAPEMYTAAKSLYGSEGACWTMDGISEDDCHIECRAFLRAIHGSFPEVEECVECLDDADCPANAPYCYDDEGLCQEEQIMSCDIWEIRGRCFEFGEGFSHQEKRDWCALIDEAYGPGLDSERTTPCKTDGAWGRCEYIGGGDQLASGPIKSYYYFDNASYPWLEDEAEMACSQVPDSTWVPF